MQKRRPGVGGVDLLGGDLRNPTPPCPDVQRERFAVVLEPSLWRGFDVTVSPPTSAFPLRHFRDRTEALLFAEQLASLQGWPLHDRTSDG